MNPKQFILSLAICFFCSLISLAQNPVTTLQHHGTTQVYYGQNSFIEAYDASVDGDTLNLSVGGFTPPPSIAKGITVIGAGHFPDSTSVKIRTAITGTITINAGADSLHLEGLYINGDIYYGSANSIRYVKILRCRLYGTGFNGNCTLSNCSYEDCIVDNSMNFDSRYGTVNNLTVKHCIINGACIITGSNDVIDGNLLLANSTSAAISALGATIKNNIFLTTIEDFMANINNVFYNNLFVATIADFGSGNYGSNNYLGIPQADIFVNQSGNTFDYTHDYHLKDPETYIGTDGTQVGLYGGLIPFKDKGMPFNPQITSKSIATKTDADGNLNVNVTVKAQEN